MRDFEEKQKLIHRSGTGVKTEPAITWNATNTARSFGGTFFSFWRDEIRGHEIGLI